MSRFLPGNARRDPPPATTGGSTSTLPRWYYDAPNLPEEQQRGIITNLMSDIYRAGLDEQDPLYLPLSPTALDAHVNALNMWANQNPDLVLSVRDELAPQFGYDPGSNSGSADAGITAALNQILSTAESTTTTQTITTNTSEGVTRTGTRESERTTGQRVTRFIDIPTEEEFMNDFTVGHTSYVQGLLRQGSITREAADWAMDNQEFFYTQYLTDLSRRVEAGEDIFKVVGAEGTPVKVGERMGDSTFREYSGVDREAVHERVVTNERTRIEEDVRTNYVSTGTLTTTEQEQQIQQETDRRVNEETNRLINEAISYHGTEAVLTVEEIFARPNLTTVFKISPADFLTSQFTPHSLEQTAAGQRGTEQARAVTARGIAPSAPRRLGGV